MLPFFGYEDKFDLMGSEYDFKHFNGKLNASNEDRKEATLEGVNVRAMLGLDGAKDRQLYNFNHL